MKPVRILLNSKYLACSLFACLLIMGCSSSHQNSTMMYPRKPADTDNRKAGRAMLFYEQAEKDLDVNNSVIVVPPKENPGTPAKQQE